LNRGSPPVVSQINLGNHLWRFQELIKIQARAIAFEKILVKNGSVIASERSSANEAIS